MKLRIFIILLLSVLLVAMIVNDLLKYDRYEVPSFSSEMEENLVLIIWYKVTPTGFEPVKKWCGEEAIDIFRLILKEPDVKDYSHFVDVFKMSLIFYSGQKDSLEIKEFWFEIVANKFYSKVTCVNYELGERLSPYMPENGLPDMERRIKKLTGDNNKGDEK